ncbi:MAG: hypothetical protein COY69_00985 [Candidatus Magasanikbacteria bacterium CG_4_10_14_0_8_um_filter_32_14]|uniref:Lipoprotein n=2 Tax=Candidatus Magasanikiibacteriota TaxID=1752731 RepID=A0A2M7R9W6_9BACT|nr:MAG: hypothetical protein AUJ23_02335 [Candidatus Magasanikbacteria bacterium CG1_02_32_51]PIY93555.1 MAG: hypothetical protein COY69_00985 [Candidatus Magasanikbacteria bacterium CG_4_10_14_0_8_um_filter_32_14]
MLSRVLKFIFIIILSSGCNEEDQQQINWTVDEASTVMVGSSVSCPVETVSSSNEGDILRICEETGKDVVVSVLPRSKNAVSPDEQVDLFEIMVTPCKSSESVWVVSISLNIKIPKGNGDEDMLYTLFHTEDGSPHIIAIEVLEGTQTLIGTSFLQRISTSEANVYLPQPASDEDQVLIAVPSEGKIFTVVGWFDFPEEAKLGRYNISLDSVGVVNQKGHGLSSAVLCNGQKDLKQLTVR